MKHRKVHTYWRIRVGDKSHDLRVSYRWVGLYAAKFGDAWFWISHDKNGCPFIDPHRPIPGGNYDDGIGTAA